MIVNPYCPFHGTNPVKTWTAATKCLCPATRAAAVQFFRDFARQCHNGAGDPWQEFYDHGAAPLLERIADRLEREPKEVMLDTEVGAKVCPACSHVHNDSDCAECPCEYDTSFCGVCGWSDCECEAESR